MAFAQVAARKILTVSGQDAQAFLQGLVTIDMRKVAPGRLWAGAFLNAKGRILYDIFLAQNPKSTDSFDIETSAEFAEDLADMLTRYKLRRKVAIETDEERKVFAVWAKGRKKGAKETSFAPKEGESWFADPRPGHLLGQRLWAKDLASSSISSARKLEEDVYHQIRIACGLTEGLAECEDDLPFVHNYDWWPGTLAFDKGCYTGQELIARTHFKGQVRKRVVPVVLSTERTVQGLEADFLPEYVSQISAPVTYKALPALGAAVEPISGADTKVGEGSLIALAPGGLNIAIVAFRDAQSVPPPSSEFKATHQISVEGSSEKIQVCPIRPEWWPPVSI